MTPEELNGIESDIRQHAWYKDNLMSLVAEVRRLWAERDARAVAGGPVSDGILDDIQERAIFAPEDADRYYLLQHIVFLERLLLDGDDLLAVRRTGYADGWRAGVEAAAKVATVRMLPETLCQQLRFLAEEGPP